MNYLNLKEVTAILACVFMLGITGCSDGPAEEAGEKLDEIVEDVSDRVDDACDEATDQNC